MRSRSSSLSPTPAMQWKRGLAQFADAARTAKLLSGKPVLQPIERERLPSAAVESERLSFNSSNASGAGSTAVSFHSHTTSWSSSRATSVVDLGSSTVDSRRTSMTAPVAEGSVDTGLSPRVQGLRRAGTSGGVLPAGADEPGRKSPGKSPGLTPPLSPNHANAQPLHRWLHELPEAVTEAGEGLAFEPYHGDKQAEPVKLTRSTAASRPGLRLTSSPSSAAKRRSPQLSAHV